MRTTLSIDDDVLERARRVARETGRPQRIVINEALRIGLEAAEKPLERRPYKTDARELGLREGYDLDNVQELLSRLDNEAQR